MTARDLLLGASFTFNDREQRRNGRERRRCGWACSKGAESCFYSSALLLFSSLWSLKLSGASAGWELKTLVCVSGAHDYPDLCTLTAVCSLSGFEDALGQLTIIQILQYYRDKSRKQITKQNNASCLIRVKVLLGDEKSKQEHWECWGGERWKSQRLPFCCSLVSVCREVRPYCTPKSQPHGARHGWHCVLIGW